MNIALCHPYVLPERGGCETYIAELTRWLVSRGHKVHLYAWEWDRAALPQEVTCHRPAGPRRCWRPRRPWLFSLGCQRAMRQRRHDVSVGFDKTFGQDVLYPQGGLHLASARHAVGAERGVRRAVAWVRQRLDLAYWSFARLEYWQYRRYRPLIAVNSRMVAGHFERYYGLGADRVRVVPAAIDPVRVTSPASGRTGWREGNGLSVDDVVALFVATNGPLKGLGPLLHALARVPTRVPLKVAAVSVREPSPFVHLARRLGVIDRVQFYPHTPNLGEWYQAADFLVHPTFYDPCSLVVLEALAARLPVITSRFNGASERFHSADEGVILDDPHDVDALAAALVRLADPAARTGLARTASVVADRWTYEDHYRALLNVFDEASAARRARAA